jgi:hypothetical protein
MVKWLYMDPNQQPPTYSVDYLNQIAPTAPKKSPFSRMQIIIGVIVAIFVVLIITLIVIVAINGNDNPTERLAAKLATTEKIVTDAQNKLKSTELRTLNSNLKIYLANTNRDIVEPLRDVNVVVTNLDPAIVTSESGTDITDRLADASLNALYDRTYAREISYQLEIIVALMQKIYGSTSSKSLKSFLESATTNLTPTQKSFSDFNAANS